MRAVWSVFYGERDFDVIFCNVKPAYSDGVAGACR